MKQHWLDSVAHIHAQGAAIFFITMVVFIVLLVWHDVKKENK